MEERNVYRMDGEPHIVLFLEGKACTCIIAYMQITAATFSREQELQGLFTKTG